MSWTSNDTGRPLEEGGHERINISANLYTREVLDQVENKSAFVEYAIHAATQPQWIEYQNPQVTLSNPNSNFTEAATFEYVPHLIPGNAILGIRCFFEYCCEDSDILFRVTVNGKKGHNLIQHSNDSTYTCSCVYSENLLGFRLSENAFHGKNRYVFRFQFKSVESGVVAQVKNINLFLRVVENPCLNDGGQMEASVKTYDI
jgi:hypothetical protein